MKSQQLACAALVACVLGCALGQGCQQPKARPPREARKFVSQAIDELIAEWVPKFKDPDLATIFANALPNTLDTTVQRFVQGAPTCAAGGAPAGGAAAAAAAGPGPQLGPQARFLADAPAEPSSCLMSNTNDTFIITGDINAMWLRDSANQVRPYLPYARTDGTLRALLAGLVVRQTKSVLIDSFANAFNLPGNPPSPNSQDSTSKPGFAGSRLDGMTLDIFERKYELDSLVNFLSLSLSYYNATEDASPLGSDWGNAVAVALDTMTAMQAGSDEHHDNPPYVFMRTTNRPTDTLEFGTGPPAARTGMVRTAFRPSDDAAKLPFNIASNAFAVSVLTRLAPLLRQLSFADAATRAVALASEIEAGIRQFGIMDHPTAGRIFAYEVDGFGNQYFMDDANLPSLLGLPYLGYCSASDPLYVATRKAVLSRANPYYFSGSAGDGTGGPHNGYGYIWPMSIIARGFTSLDEEEITQCLKLLVTSSACTGLMHESFWQSSVGTFTRPWFAWANSFFGEFILHLGATKPHLLF